jgi:hypothetical protein
MRTVDLHDLSEAPDIAIALGNVVVAWARAETTLVLALSAISGMHPHMASDGFYRIPTFESRIKFIRALIQEWQPIDADKNALDKAIEKLSSLASTRNRWVHAIWTREEPSGQIFIIDGRSMSRVPVKSADIVNHLHAVMKRTTDLEELIRPFCLIVQKS